MSSNLSSKERCMSVRHFLCFLRWQQCMQYEYMTAGSKNWYCKDTRNNKLKGQVKAGVSTFIFSVNRQKSSFQRMCVLIGCSTLCVLATGGVSMTWLAVESSDVRYLLKLASGDLTSWVAFNTVNWLVELRWTSLLHCNPMWVLCQFESPMCENVCCLGQLAMAAPVGWTTCHDLILMSQSDCHGLQGSFMV